jgi:hypothetical protein
MLNAKVAELSANEYLVADFLSWGKIFEQGQSQVKKVLQVELKLPS